MNMTPIHTITGGTVAVEDGTKAKEEYAPARKVKVELSFAVPEGQDGTMFLNGIARIADNKVREMLGKDPVSPQLLGSGRVFSTPAAEQPETPAAAPAKEKTTTVKKPKAAAEPKMAERTKADLEREAGLPVTKATSDDELLEEPAKPAAVEEDDLGEILGEAAPPPVTDLELGKAAQEKNAKMKAELGDAWAPARIRELIAKYSGGKRINDIPAAQRPAFLKELAALK